MTKAVMYRSKDGLIKGFDIKGHAGASGNGEYDMVCAAISAVCYTALGSLDEHCGFNRYSESDGHLRLELPGDMNAETEKKAQIILETMEIGLRQIENQYSRYIEVRMKEV